MIEWKELMLRGGLEELFVLHTEDFWHEQDFFRLLHDTTPERFRAAGKDLVDHCVHAAAADIEESGPRDFAIRGSATRPVLIHFAGGFWRKFPSVMRLYRRSWETIVPVEGRFRTLVFGAGMDGRRLLENLPAQESMVGFVDNDPAKHGLPAAGHLVFSPVDLRVLEFDRIHLACYLATSALHRQLLSLGIPENKFVSPLFDAANRGRLAALRKRFAGRPALILGDRPDPSIDGLMTKDLGDLVLMACNRLGSVAESASIMLFDDLAFAGREATAIASISGPVKLLPEVVLRWVEPRDDATLFGMNYVNPESATKLVSSDPFEFAWGGSSVHTGLQWALYFGCAPICFVGFRVAGTDAGLSDVDDAGRAARRRSAAVRALEAVRNAAEQSGCRIYDAGFGEELAVFPHVAFDRMFPPGSSC